MFLKCKREKILSMFCIMLILSIFLVSFDSHAKASMSLYVKTSNYTRTTESSKKVKTQTISIKNLTTKYQVSWKSSNTSIATVKAQKKAGMATLSTKLGKKGSAIITATITNKMTKAKFKTFSKKITVEQGATGIAIVDKKGNAIKSLSTPLTKTLPLYANVLPKGKVSVKSHHKITWSMPQSSKTYATLNQSKKTLTPNQTNLTGRGVKNITLTATGYKNVSSFKKSLRVYINGGTLKPDRNINETDLSFKVRLSVSGNLNFLKNSSLTLTGISGNAKGKKIQATCKTVQNGVATFVCQDSSNVLTDETGEHNGNYKITSNINGLLFSSNQINYTDANYTKKVEIATAQVQNIIDKFPDYSFSFISRENETLELKALERIPEEFNTTITFTNTDHIDFENDKFILKKVNTTDKTIHLPFNVTITHPSKLAKLSVVKHVTLPIESIDKRNLEIVMAQQFDIDTYKNEDFKNTDVYTWDDNGHLIGLFWSSRNLNDNLDLSQLTHLESLHCASNGLSRLDVSKLTNLKILDCSMNYLTDLDVSSLTSLEELHCFFNCLSALDVSKVTKLKVLDCYRNDLTSLTVSTLSNLYKLHCGNNQLNSLDVSNLANLKFLICSYNPITQLNVSRTTNLEKLECNDNKLSILDITYLSSLKILLCTNNQLSTLNVRNLPNLEELYCNSNELTSINLQDLPKLKILHCSHNMLPTLDISNLSSSNNSNLQEVQCNNNNTLVSLNVQNVPNLKILYCNNNENLRTLNIVNLPSLQNLRCYNNKLNDLVVQNVPELQSLLCNNNLLPTLTITNLPNLKDFRCNNNNLTTLIVEDLPKLYSLHCKSNPNLQSLNIAKLPPIPDFQHDLKDENLIK